MLKSSIIEGTNIVTVTYRGSLGADEMDALRSDLTKVADQGPVRLLVQYEDVDLGKIEPEALWKDLKTAGMLNQFERCAVVADEGWIKKIGSITSRLVPFEVKVFAVADRDDAVAWLGREER